MDEGSPITTIGWFPSEIELDIFLTEIDLCEDIEDKMGEEMSLDDFIEGWGG